MQMSKVKSIIREIIRYSRHLTIFSWLAIFVGLAGVIFFILYISKQEKWVKVEVQVTRPEWWWQTQNPPYWLIDDIKKGNQQYDSLGRKIAEVTEVRSYEWGENQKVSYLTLNLKTELDKRTKTYKYDNQPLSISQSIDLAFQGIGFQGLVTFIEGIPDPRQFEDKTVEARILEWSNKFPDTLGILPWRADAINVGDKMKDSQGRILAEVLDKKVMPAEKVVVTADGRVLDGQDPIKKDVTLIIKLRTIKQNNVNYFLDNIKVKVGAGIPLFLPLIDTGPEITKIIK